MKTSFPLLCRTLLVSFITLLAAGSRHWAQAGNGQWTIIGWNNLGMHCMDDDYSVLSILPPFNTVDAQVIDAAGKLVKIGAGVTVMFEAVADPDGSINRTAIGKSNFWDYVLPSYGAALAPDAGLFGTHLPGAANTPQPMLFSGAFNWFEALGIPIAPIDDAGHGNPYPLMRLTARNAAGAVLATTDVVLPVSGEMNCRACHSSGAGPAAMPGAGWVNDPHQSRDYRLNVLRLHDEKQLANPVFQTALAANGFRPDGLYATATIGGRPILCAICHASEALGTAGAPGTPALTRAMHAKHAGVVNPENGLALNNIANRSACYTCHPGSTTRCLRGAMGAAVASDGSASMQCQSCHGTMSQVGAADRIGWLDEPQCGNCHTGTATQNNGLVRYLTVFDSNGQRRQPVNTTFATNADTLAPGLSLYRFSKGHGGLQCSACHGSTHAEFPATHRNDNLQSVQLQGHAGVLTDCLTCHATMPNTTTGGPHGMHSISENWVDDHADRARAVGLAVCQSCHGTDYRGTVLSRAQGDRSFTTKSEYGTPKRFWRGQEIGCYECHQGVNSSNPSTRTRPVVSNATLAVAEGVPTPLTLSATGTGPVRIVAQPAHGAVALAGRIATYIPEPGFAGPDLFTYAASDTGGYVDSTSVGVVSVTVGSAGEMLTRDRDGDGLGDFLEYALGLLPDFPSTSGASAPRLENFGGANYLTLDIARFLPPPDVTVAIEVSGNLTTWSPAIVLTNTGTALKARDPVPAASAARRFIRVKSTRP